MEEWLSSHRAGEPGFESGQSFQPSMEDLPHGIETLAVIIINRINIKYK